MADSRYLNLYTDFGFFRQAEIAQFTEKEYSDYEESLHNLWNITNAMNDAEMKGFGKRKEIGLEEGIEQGRKEGIAEGVKQNSIDTAKRMKSEGLDINLIAKITQLPIDEIEEL